MRSTLRLGLAFFLVSCFSRGLCQSGSSVYETFFRQVVQLKNISGPVLVNGQPGTITLPTIQEAIDLTDHESQILNASALDCEAKFRSLDSEVAPLVFEARLQLIASESEKTPAPLVEQLKNLGNRRNRILQEHIQQLRSAFGDSRFQMLDTFVRSGKLASFFPKAVPAKR